MRDMRHNPDFDHEEGMTLRDYFAAKAMMAYLTHEQGATAPESMIAGAAYAVADAMLKARGEDK